MERLNHEEAGGVDAAGVVKGVVVVAVVVVSGAGTLNPPVAAE